MKAEGKYSQVKMLYSCVDFNNVCKLQIYNPPELKLVV